MTFRIEPARERDVPLILSLIKGLADYEKLAHEVRATEEGLRATLFGARPAAEVLIAYAGDEPVGFALFFHNYSTFLGKRGLYLEDLFVVPEWRGRGAGRALLTHLAQDRRRARLRPVRMVGARLERARDRVLQEPRREADGRVDHLSRHR